MLSPPINLSGLAGILSSLVKPPLMNNKCMFENVRYVKGSNCENDQQCTERPNASFQKSLLSNTNKTLCKKINNKHSDSSSRTEVIQKQTLVRENTSCSVRCCQGFILLASCLGYLLYRLVPRLTPPPPHRPLFIVSVILVILVI